MQHIQSDVKHFMEKAGQEMPRYPKIPDNTTCELRVSLIQEECAETCEAIRDGDVAKMADGICDSIYVLVGTAIAFGIDLTPIWKLVQEANMAKFCPGSYRREDGKQMKPPGWVAPDEAIAAEIKSQIHQ